MARKKKRREQVFKRRVFVLLFLIYISLLLFLFHFLLLSETPIEEEPIDYVAFDDCENLSLIEGAECVNEIVKGFFVYNISNIDKNLSFQKLKEEGGVCSHWSELYCSVGDNLNYYTQNVTFKTESVNITKNNKTQEYDILHKNCIWSDSSGWVILDQQKLFHFKFGDVNITKYLEDERSI